MTSETGGTSTSVLLGRLVAMSRAYGSDPALAIAGGGNTSVKVGDRLLVKASGKALAEVGPEDFVELERPALEALLRRDLGTQVDEREAAFKTAVLSARAYPERGQRPSVESLLHHLVPGRFVVHLHASLVNQFACSRGGRGLVEGSLGDQVAWVEVVHPGYALAKLVQETLASFIARTGSPPRALVMQNHGLVSSGGSPEEVHANLTWLLEALGALRRALDQPSGEPVRDRPPAVGALPATGSGEGEAGGPMLVEEVRAALKEKSVEGACTGNGWTVDFDLPPAVVRLFSSETGPDFALGGPVTPDQIVYCGPVPLWVGSPPGGTAGSILANLAGGWEQYGARRGRAPKVVLVQGLGLFAIGRSPKEAKTARLVYVDALEVMEGAAELGGVSYLDQAFCSFIEHWEVEAYRRQVAM